MDSSLLEMERLAIDWAERAGHIALRHWRHLAAPAQTKSDPTDLVTAADLEVEEFLRREIAARLPDHGFIGEESKTPPPKRSQDIPRHAWIVDPIDGTTNFAHGFEQFAISIAYWRDGTPATGVVYRPATGHLFQTTRGFGARCNGRPIGVSKVPQLAQSLSVTGYGYDRRQQPEKYLDVTRKMLVNTQGVRRLGSAALDLCEVAQGGFDFYAELKLSIWDVAAGVLILEEAGGRVTRFDGSPLGIDFPNILATNGLLHNEAQALMGA